MNYFFGIGISAYLKVSVLNNAVKDVNDVAEILINRYDFESENCLILTNNEATRSDIIDNFERYRDRISDEDSLLIYYSGHGYITQDKRGFWLPVDASSHKVSSFIGNEVIQTYIRAIKSKHTLLISDSCFAGSLLIRAEEEHSMAMEELGKRQSRWVFASGRHNEKVSDGIKGRNSPFASALLTELRLNNQQQLNVQKLGGRVVEITRNNYKQLPEICPLFDSGDEGGQFIFKLKGNFLQNSKQSQVQEQEQFDDDFEWYLTLKSDKLNDYQSYLLNFSTGKFTRDAINRIIEISIKNSNTAESTVSNNSTSTKRQYDAEYLMFIFGKVNSGKSTVIASLLNFLHGTINVNIDYNNENAGQRLSQYFQKLLVGGEFPNRTVIGDPLEINIDLIPVHTDGKALSLTILEMSGEDLEQISPLRKNKLPGYIDVYLQRNCQFTFTLVVEVNGDRGDDFLTAAFIKYIISLRLVKLSFILLISKWDTYKGSLEISEYIKENLPSVTALLENSGLSFIAIEFTVGSVFEEKIVNVDNIYPKILWNSFIKGNIKNSTTKNSFWNKLTHWLNEKPNISQFLK